MLESHKKGTDFTFRNVKIVTEAIINVLRTEDLGLREVLGVKDFEDVKKRGIVVGHDNRFLGSDFARVVMGLLNREGIKVYYGGETTTPEISACIEMLDAACSINITPSHNPSNYSGLKFNPSDGGPAGPEITERIQQEANALMSTTTERANPEPTYESIDTTELYIEYLQQMGTIDLQKVRDFIKNSDCLIVVDHVHGATRGRPERLFDAEAGTKLRLLRTEDDYLFGGVAPEPSAENMKNVIKVLKDGSATFRIGAIMDPDGDRIRLADHKAQIPMNYFGAMALHFLHVYKGIKGVVVKSVGTSNFVNAIADRLGIKVVETKVGFKNFRPYMLKSAPERAIVAFEESDGISAYNHTLEKDALFGLLLAVEMVATTGKNLSDYLNELMDEYGHYYPDRSGIEVDRALAGEELRRRILALEKHYPAGSSMRIGDRDLRITEVVTIDGIKFILEDGSWLMIRPSGTEPKVRFYIESRDPKEKEDVFNTAKRLTEEAIRGSG
jgi:phosphomannomutase